MFSKGRVCAAGWDCAVVSRGRRAWTHLKTTAAEQRLLWRQVGEALAYGRALHPSNQAFGAWCTEQGFDMDARVRSDAMWLASSVDQKTEVPAGLATPGEIRRWFNEQQADTPPCPELVLEVPSKLTAGVEVVAPIAKKVNKLAQNLCFPYLPAGSRSEWLTRYLTGY
jgi:hypothetical protein